MTNWRMPPSSAAIQRASSQRVRSTSPKMVSSGRKPSGEAIASSIRAPVSPARCCATRSGPPPTLAPICGATERASHARIAAAHCAVGKAASGRGAASGSAVALRVQACSRYASSSDKAATKQQSPTSSRAAVANMSKTPPVLAVRARRCALTVRNRGARRGLRRRRVRCRDPHHGARSFARGAWRPLPGHTRARCHESFFSLSTTALTLCPLLAR